MTIWQLLGAIGISFTGCALLLDCDWKRKLFETHQERMARDPKYRECCGQQKLDTGLGLSGQ
ncbi:hypothetical protein EQ831_16060 [Pseudomonas sp. ALS1279]|nr:hypothetical protein [Pseudomonas sp. ALS1279]TRO37216.1 hypothetical protein EQ831_16060 [Pseudomonas sp. ALS1279]